MARTDRAAAAQAIRREAFVDAGLRLIQAKGYEQMSVQDVLDELDASKGAFYHYFDSKRALLLAAIERMTDVVLATLAPLLEDPTLAALEKLEGLFNGIAAWKSERKDLMLAALRTWASDDNAIVREKLRRSTRERLVPIIAAIVRQGVDEGRFAVGSPDETALVIVLLIQGFQEVAGELFFARQASTVSFEAVERMVASQVETMDRILGLPPGSFTGLDRDILRLWFG
jgi:AcrR family transcriptional regulator